MYLQTEAIEIQKPGYLSAVFGFFGLALLVTASGVFSGFWFASSYPEIFSNPLLYYGAIITELILAFTAHSWSKKLPVGYLMFFLFAFLSGFTLVPILALAGAIGGATMIGKALFSSVCVFTAAALFGWTTEKNLIGIGGFLFMALMGLIVVSVLGIFFPWNNTMELVVSGFGVLLFSGFVIYDIQVLQRTQLINPLLGALMLYINFINIFVSVLRFMIALGRE